MDGTARPSFRLDVEQLKRPYVQNRRASVLKSVRTITRASLIDLFGEGGFPPLQQIPQLLEVEALHRVNTYVHGLLGQCFYDAGSFKKNVRGYARKEERVLVQGRKAFVVFLLGFPSR